MNEELNTDARRVVGRPWEARSAEALERIADSLQHLEAVICNPPHISVPGNLTDEQAAKLKEALAKEGPGPIILSGMDGSRTIIGRSTTELTFETATPPDPTVSLRDAEPGLYWFEGTLIFKSEYKTERKRNGVGTGFWQPDAYVVESGEYFWGGAKTSEERSQLMLTPVRVNLP